MVSCTVLEAKVWQAFCFCYIINGLYLLIFSNIILIFCLQFSCRAFFAVVFLHITSHRSLVNQTVWWVLSLLLLLLQHGKEIIELSCHQIGLDSLEEVDWQTDVYSKALSSVNRCCMNWSQISSALFVDLSKNVLLCSRKWIKSWHRVV